MISSYRPPFVVQKLFNDFIWQTTNDKILLTFDDGPTEIITPKILGLLRKKNIRAAFFCVGRNVQMSPGLILELINDGHLIANHTMKHRVLTRLTRDESLEEIRSFNELIKEKFNYEVKYFRPPYGRFNLRTNNLLKKLSLKNVMWSLLSHDYENAINKVRFGIDKYLKRNSIIVFHDNVKSNSIIEGSLEYTLNIAANRGFEFGEPEDCLK